MGVSVANLIHMHIYTYPDLQALVYNAHIMSVHEALESVKEEPRQKLEEKKEEKEGDSAGLRAGAAAAASHVAAAGADAGEGGSVVEGGREGGREQGGRDLEPSPAAASVSMSGDTLGVHSCLLFFFKDARCVLICPARPPVSLKRWKCFQYSRYSTTRLRYSTTRPRYSTTRRE